MFEHFFKKNLAESKWDCSFIAISVPHIQNFRKFGPKLKLLQAKNKLKQLSTADWPILAAPQPSRAELEQPQFWSDFSEILDLKSWNTFKTAVSFWLCLKKWWITLLDILLSWAVFPVTLHKSSNTSSKLAKFQNTLFIFSDHHRTSFVNFPFVEAQFYAWSRSFLSAILRTFLGVKEGEIFGLLKIRVLHASLWLCISEHVQNEPPNAQWYFYRILLSPMIGKNSSKHGSIILQESVLFSLDKFFWYACKCGTIVKFIKITTV